jgi:pterin-4a-carbinolamine dehydratase
VNAIAGAMWRVSDDEKLRQSLRTKGYEQALRFTWVAAARATLAALEKTQND